MKKATIDRSRQRFFGPEETLLERWETRREKRLIYLAPEHVHLQSQSALCIWRGR